jgi:hypothetical protein
VHLHRKSRQSSWIAFDGRRMGFPDFVETVGMASYRVFVERSLK